MVCDYCTLVSFTSVKIDLSDSFYCTCENALVNTEDIEVLRDIQAFRDLESSLIDNTAQVPVNNTVNTGVPITKTEETIGEFENMLPRLLDITELARIICVRNHLAGLSTTVQSDFPGIGVEESVSPLIAMSSRTLTTLDRVIGKLFRLKDRNVETLEALWRVEPVVQPVVQALIQPVVQVIEQPVIQVVEQPVVQVVEQPVVQVVEQPVVQVVEQPVVQVVEQPVVQVVEQPVVQVVEQPVVQAVVQPEPKPVAKKEAKPVVKKQPKSAVKAETKDAVKAEAKAAVKPEPEGEAQPDLLCGICLEDRINTVLNCGHTVCRDCSNFIKECHMCRKKITARLNLFI